MFRSVSITSVSTCLLALRRTDGRMYPYRGILGGGLGLLLGVSQPAAAFASGALQPVTPWKIENRVTQCMASREYGRPDKPVTFAIVPGLDGSTFELLLAYKRSAAAVAREMRGTVDFGSGSIDSWSLKYVTGDKKHTVYRFRLSAAQMAQARTAQQISLYVDGQANAKLALDSTGQVLDSLQKCEGAVRDYWNFDGEKNGRISTPAKGELRAVFSPDDYPGDALSRDQEGSSQFLLMIDEKGSVAGCQVVSPSGVPILDAMGCAVLQTRTKFSPALDSSGKPVRSTVQTGTVQWLIAG
jgi:hypothetical protein